MKILLSTIVLSVLSVTSLSAQVCRADYNHSGKVDFDDMILYAQNYGRKAPTEGFDPRIDIDGDKSIGFSDLLAIAQDYGKVCASEEKPFMLLNNIFWKDVPAPTPLGWGQPTVDDTSMFSGEVMLFSHDCVWSGPYPNYDYSHGDEARVRACVHTMKDSTTATYGVFDTEVFGISASAHGEEFAKKEAQKLMDLVTWAKDEASKYKPEKKVYFGHYDEFPMSNYWVTKAYQECLNVGTVPEATCALNSGYTTWKHDNDVIMPYASNVDFIAPSLYMGDGENPTGWVTSAKVTIKYANRYGVPVIPYIWDEHHDAGPMPGQHISGSFWTIQLNTLIGLTQGAIMWSGLERMSDVKAAPFYAATQQFVLEQKARHVLGINPRSRLIFKAIDPKAVTK